MRKVRWGALAALICSTLGMANCLAAVPLLAPGDAVIGIDVKGSRFPAAESPEQIIDGLSTTKYLNFGEVGSGFIVTPGGSTNILSFIITTANDSPERDPSNFQLYGTNDPITSEQHSQGLAENWTLIDGFALDAGSGYELPSTRGTDGPLTFLLSNSSFYNSYKMIFTDVKDSAAANSMQIAEVQFFTDFGTTDVLDPGDPIIGIDAIGSDSSYPAGEAPGFTVDGTLAKYLNFGGRGAGIIVTPASGESIVQSFTLTTANDAPERDPATWELYGTNQAVVSSDNSLGNGEMWTLIDAGAVELPTDRNTVGPTVAVNNTAAYTSYRMVFPNLRDNNSIFQIAEIQFEGIRTIPEPSTVVLAGLALAGMGLVARRKVA